MYMPKEITGYPVGEKKYTKTEKWLAKKGIKEDKNKTNRGFRRRKSTSEAISSFSKPSEGSHHHDTISQVRFTTMDINEPGPYGTPTQYPSVIPPVHSHPYPYREAYLTPQVIETAHRVTDQFFDEMKALSGILEKALKGAAKRDSSIGPPPMHPMCGCQLTPEDRWYEVIAARSEFKYDNH
jgi:ribosomal protein L44E